MEVGIVAQHDNGRATRLAADLRASLRERGVTVRVDRATATALGDDEGAAVADYHECDLIVSVGGDGTFLFAARGGGETPILGVNLGEVGFLNAVGPAEAVDAVDAQVTALEAGDLTTREMPRIAAQAAGVDVDPAVNEVVVAGGRRGRGGGLDAAVSVDGSRYAAGDADGVLVATPTGSTAYNLSEHGPLVHHAVDALVLNQMAAAEPMPPLLLGLDSEVTVRVRGDRPAAVVCDGRRSDPLDPPVEVRIARTGPPVRIAGPSADFFAALDKLD
ncbi:MAG: NAD(+)/NADH kinase [Haloferacaceae archaeon]